MLFGTQAYRNGRDAFHAGKHITQNPYPCGCDNSNDWYRGFREARQDEADMDYLNACMTLGQQPPWSGL